MKAIVCTRYGFPKAFQFKEVERPVPGDNEVLVEIHASSVTFSNQIFMNNKFFIFRVLFGKKTMPDPGIPGSDMSGRVVAIGKDVNQFKPGDEVYGDLFGRARGAFAEYACVPENLMALKPVNLSFAEERLCRNRPS